MIIEGYNSKKEAIKVKIKNSKILKIKQISKPNKEQYILPGFIDVHTHGGYGYDFDKGKDNLEQYAKRLPQEGTTSFLGTSATTSRDQYDKSFKDAALYIENQIPNYSKVLGIHSEGVYLDASKKGAHNDKLFKVLDKKEIDHLLETSNGYLKYITYAIENSSTDTTKYLSSKNIVASVGHSSATLDDVMKHEKNGLTNITHTFNAMTGVDHRNPGIAVAAMVNDNLYVEIIADGFHVHPQVVNLLYKAKGVDKVIVITDSAPPKGMPNGNYKFVGYNVIKKGNKLINELGSIAGSVSTMHGNFLNIMKYTGCSLDDARKMTSSNAAKSLNLDKEIGYIKEGYVADIIILDKELNLKKTIINGEISYEN